MRIGDAAKGKGPSVIRACCPAEQGAHGAEMAAEPQTAHTEDGELRKRGRKAQARQTAGVIRVALLRQVARREYYGVKRRGA